MALTTVKAAGIAADSIDETKIADNGIDSEHYNDGSIDHAHLANDAVDGDNIADDSINSEHYADGSIDTAHIADDQVTLAKMAGLARGKIIYGDASGNPAALALGSNGQVLKSDGTDIAWAADAGGAALSNDANNRVVTADGSGGINGEANLTFDGNDLTLGDGNLILADGHGISFADTGDGNQGSSTAEILNDYEEGSWTPQIRFGNGAPSGVTYAGNNNVGVYTKIGRLIMCIGEINLTSKGTSTGYFAITGFPYNEGNYGGNIAKASSSIGHYYYMNNWARWYGLDLFNNDDVAIFRGGGSANTNDDRSNSDVNNNSNIQFAVTYFTDE